MIFRYYSEGLYSPERGGGGNWHVWCRTGALQVLQTREYVYWLNRTPNEDYVINFANGAYALIDPTHSLWMTMADIAKEYDVLVFQLDMGGGYVPWTGKDDDLREFDAIMIRVKT